MKCLKVGMREEDWCLSAYTPTILCVDCSSSRFEKIIKAIRFSNFRIMACFFPVTTAFFGATGYFRLTLNEEQGVN